MCNVKFKKKYTKNQRNKKSVIYLLFFSDKINKINSKNHIGKSHAKKPINANKIIQNNFQQFIESAKPY